MLRNAGLLLRSAVLSLALASVFACAAEDTSEQQGSTGSDLSKGNKHAKDASADDSDGGITSSSDGGFVDDASVGDYDASYEDSDASADDSDGGVAEDAAVRW